MKNVQIPYDLFVALLQYHLMMDDDYANEIRHGLEQKLEAMVRHEWYAKYKTAPNPEEREAARQRYLDERGVPQSFRWQTSPFSVDDKYFYNLPADKKKQILDYPLFVYVCDGTDSEKLDWFRIINIAGEQLTDQELRNAVYAGSWVSDAKRYFSKTGCAADTLAGDYLKGASIRQEYLETAILWAASAEGKTIEAYMAQHQNDPSAVILWNYFRSVIDWVQAIFPKKRKEMKGLPWGLLYNVHGKRTDLNPKKLELEIQRLMGDEDVTKKSGIYEYLLTGEEKKLSIRAFDRRDALAAYEKQGHKCPICGETFEFEQMHADHITPWSKGGKTTPENCQMLCRDCNLKKGAQE